MDAGFELLMTQGAPMYYSDIPVREGIYEVMNGIVMQVHLTLELLGSQTHLLVSECIIRMNTAGC